MSLGKWARLLLAAAPLLAGCKDFWVNPNDSSGSGSCTTNCSTASSGNFYILNNGTTPQIVGETINSGAIAAVGSATTTLSTPYAMAMGFSGKYLYLSTDSGVWVYPVYSNGLGSPVQVDSNTATAYAIAVDGNWLVEAVQTSPSPAGQVNFYAVPLDSSTGASCTTNCTIQTAGFYTTNNNPTVQNGGMAVSHDGSYIFVALQTGGLIYFPFYPNTQAGNNPFGTATSVPIIPVKTSNSSVLSVAVDPGSNLFYVGETYANTAGTSGAVLAYGYSNPMPATAGLTAIAGSPFDSGGTAPNAILPVKASNTTSPVYVYVASGNSTGKTGNIVSFSVTYDGTSSYALASGSTIAAGTQPYSLAVDSTGTYLLAVNNSTSTPYFDAYTFDSTTAGQLDFQFSANTGASPLAIVAVPGS